jgi:acyl transferase domain-containing protein
VSVVSLPPVAVGERRLRPRIEAALRLGATGRVRVVVAATSACALLGVGLVHLDARADLRAEREALVQARLEQAAAADGAPDLGDVAHAASRRTALPHRAAVVAGDHEELRAGLRAGLRAELGDAQRAQIQARAEELHDEMRARVDGLLEEQRVCFKQLSLEAGELAVTHDRARRQLEARLEAIEKQ